MLPENSIEDIEESTKAYKTFKLDLENKRIGEIIDGKEALEQAVKMALLVERYKYPAFSHYYGTEYSGVFDEGPLKAMGRLKSVICDSLCHDERIIAVDNFSFERRGSKTIVNFRVLSIYGESDNVVEVSG